LAAATRIANARGKDLGARFRQRRAPGRLGPERALTAASELLERYGYEPDRPSPATLQLRNCPFHTLARRAPEVVCAINQALVQGVLRGLGDRRIQAALAPRPGACCVELRGPERPRRPARPRVL
jgi:predicted ArsR family transcriptional regulator